MKSDASIKRPDAPVVPIDYAGRWVAWDSLGTRIVASAATLQEAVQAAAAAGEKEPVFAKVPRLDVHLVGLSR